MKLVKQTPQNKTAHYRCKDITAGRMLNRILPLFQHYIYNALLCFGSVLDQSDRKWEGSNLPTRLPLSPNPNVNLPPASKAQNSRDNIASRCDVGASKNAEQAFSTQRNLHIC